MSDRTELGIVIPVFNEEDRLESLLMDWDKVFSDLGIRHCFIVINDGSADGSLEVLGLLQKQMLPIFIDSQPNQGHGPAILNGYARALPAEWVFQIDADHQFETMAFGELWTKRADYDLLIAERIQKKESLARGLISAVSKMVVRLLYGGQVQDANSPYRLLRSSVLEKALGQIPKNSFAPNLLLTAYFIIKKYRIFQTTVKLRNSGQARKSKMNSYFLSGSIRSFLQTVAFRFKL